MGEPERHSNPSLIAACPGLGPVVAWDDPGHLRGELYARDHLNAHASELAKAHGKPSFAATPGPLRRRFAQARQRVFDAYEILGRGAKDRREPSPAEEWLLDNANVVEDQIREIAEDLPFGYLVELPRIAYGAMRGYPRVYGLCLDYLRHTDGRVDTDTLSGFVLGYQAVGRLSIGELWAVPIMLRLGLILRVGALAASEAGEHDRASADRWAERLLASAGSPAQTGSVLHELEKTQKPLTASFLVRLLKRLREHDGSLELTHEWIAAQSAAMDTTPDELTRREHLRQAADQVSVGNAITSMRAISAMDWDEFFERTSDVEAVLRQDPAEAYSASDKATRDRYRHAVEALARRSDKDEVQVARAALELSRVQVTSEPASPTAFPTGAFVGSEPSKGSAGAHVGYYLVDAGRSRLEERIGYRPTLRASVVRALLDRPSRYYFGALGFLTLLLVWAAVRAVGAAGVSAPVAALLLILFVVPVSEVALALVNAFTVTLLPPRRLPKLDFTEGIPDEQRTLVVVPALIDSVETIDQLIGDLEVRALANSDPNLHFALLTDFVDAPAAVVEGDAQLIEHVRGRINELNARHLSPRAVARGAGVARYWLLHRRRIENLAEGCFMGWERKRGKLDELNRLLRGDTETTFSIVLAPPERFASIRNVLTLDADTELPRDVAAELVGTLAHPLNQPVIDPGRQRVVRGHAIIQPRVGTLPASSRRTRFAALLTGPSGIDPYTTAVSDTYQDLFGEGSFVGKGIYHVDAFTAALAGRVPEERMLSHDLFEGIYARSALATDIELLDEQPASYGVQVGRQHRWMRGDWQLLPWLFPRVPSRTGLRKNDLRAIDVWKIADNLRRSVLAPALVALAVGSWFAHPLVAGAAAAIVLGVYVVPLVARLLLSLVRETTSATRPNVGSLGGDLRTNSAQVALNLIFTLDQAWVSLDAGVRTLHRLFVSRRHLLEWTAMRQAASAGSSRGVPARLWLSSAASLFGLILVLWFRPDTWAFALPLLLAWSLAPYLAAWLSLPLSAARPVDALSEADRIFLCTLAQKTWRFFEQFVTATDNHLPPDNFQEDPRGVIAHRTSPTNMGLYLLGVVSARDFGFITLREARERLEQSLGTLEKLEKREGHILNWYETTTLRPLEPQYVSTVDSGNLAAYLWTLREACLDLGRTPIVSARTLESVRDALRLAYDALREPRARPKASLDEPPESKRAREGAPRGLIDKELRTLTERAAELLESSLLESSLLESSLLPSSQSLRPLVQAFSALRADIAESRARLSPVLEGDGAYWLSRAELRLAEAVDEVLVLAPWLGAAAPLSRLEAVPELAPEVARLWSQLDATGSVNALCERRGALLAALDGLAAMVRSADISAELSRECLRELDALSQAIDDSANACEELWSGLARVGERALALADGMNFRFLFDERRELFAIGYNVSSARLDGSHYDLLASEARLASLFCIAKGDAPQSHWFRLGRPRAKNPKGRALLSWSGSMFEYLMPLLCTKNNPNTLLDEAYEAAITRQREYAAEQGVPWGVSESAYNVMDLRMTYQYRAFGVPGLGLKSGLGEDLVIAPYATVLSGLVRPDLICKNLRALAKEGLEGPYGFYEAIDYTPEHVPPGRHGVVVKAFMAHHQGMSLVALDNILLDGPMQRRFHRDPRIKATELLLEERVPLAPPPPRSPATVMSTSARIEPRVDAVEHVGLQSPGPLRVQLLGHGELSSLVSATGAGVTTWKGLDVNRFREDPVLEAGGISLYIKNRTHNRLWSAGYQPTRAEPSFYNVAFSIDRVEFHRKDGDVQTVTEVALSPEHAVEVRRITLSNQGEAPLELEVTSYSEVVLAPRGADVSQRAFSNMFVETEALPERFALLAQRRPRNAGDSPVWVVQMLMAESPGFGPLDYDCSRLRFIGRGRSTADPAALASDAPLAKQSGLMLDTALALRRGVRLSAGASARLTLTTGLANTREEALGLIETYSAKHAITRAIELGWAGVRVELRHLGITPTEVHRFQRLLSAVVFPHATLRHGARPSLTPTRGMQALWTQGISGDLPIVVCRIDSSDFAELCRDVLLAHEFWRLNGYTCDLVFINEEPSGYLQPISEALRDLSRNASLFDQKGGVFLRSAAQLSEEERELLLGAARVVLRSKEGSLARQLRRVLDSRLVPPVFTPVGAPAPRLAEPEFQRPKLTYDNGVGGFGADGREYIMVLEPGVTTPSPWCNVISNPDFGTLVSEVGSSFTWARNSQRHRLTPWNNDAVCDPSGELFYVRDDDDGSYWSATPEPLGQQARFLVRHGQGYSQFEHERGGLCHELTIFVSPDEPIKFSRLRFENRGQTDRRLSVYGVVDWVLGTNRESTRVAISTSYDTVNDTLFAMNPLGLFPGQRAFLGATRPIASVTADREEFFGLSGSRQAPAALGRVRLSGAIGAGLDAAGCVHIELEVPAGETVDLSFLLGHAESLEQAQALSVKYRRDGAVNDALARARKVWVDLLGAVRVKTPDRALDLMQNNWLLYQSLSSRIWGRTGFFQSSGAYGFRDQLQDVLASIHARSSIAREHILRSAARQFVEGDVQHWWHDETGHGLRTRCSDDMLWLPYVTAEYVRMTGDRAILDEQVPFLSERLLAPGEDELFSAPAISSERASLYEHCKRALDVGITAGEHGIPLMKSGDWNDGMNRVGHEGRGESVWLGWFLAKTLTEFAQLARLVADRELEARCVSESKRIARALDAHGWDGDWYRRVSFDDGTWLGSRQNAECAIDAIAQSWAVISGVGDPERAATAVASSEARLIVPSLRMMKLLTPAFQHTTPDPGYIQSYPPGIRENGGQYTHGVLWTVLALSLLGAGDRAGELFSLLNPIRHADTPDGIERYRVEPYVLAADVYGGSGYEGRGGWTWYTGSAGWMYRIGMEHIIGLRRRGRTLAITPCIPSNWASFEIEYRHGTATYHIVVENPEHVCQGVIRLEIDGVRTSDGYIRLESDDRTHEVRVTLGRMLSTRVSRTSGSAGASQA
jgi:cyclic beta-1,2-glucan synthetase